MILFKVEEDDSVEIVPHENGLLKKKVDVQSAYQEISRKHCKSLDKFAEWITEKPSLKTPNPKV